MQSTPLLKRATLALLAILLMAAPARAQLSDVGATNPILFQASALIGNDACYDPTNHVYLLVVAYGNVFGAFVTTAGAKISTFGIGSANPSAPFGHYARCVYSPELNSGQGGFLVAWHQNDGKPNYLHSAVVAYPGGLVPGTEQVISDGTEGGTYVQDGGAMAYSPATHQIFVAWTTLIWNTQGRFVNAATGVPNSPIVEYMTSSGGGIRDPSVAWNPATNQFALGYAGWGPTGQFVGFRLVGSNGTATAATNFGFTALGTYNSTLVVNASNDYVMGWTLGNQALSAEFDQNGTILSQPRLISTRIGTATSLDFSFNPVSGTILAVGEDLLSSQAAGLELDPTGIPLSTTVGLTSGATSGSFVPRVAARTDAREWAISLAQNLNTLADQIVSTGSTGVSAGPQPLAVTLSANHTFPMGSGTSVTWTANGRGGTGPLQYQFWEYSASSGWSVGQSYTTTNTFTWTPPQGVDAVQVWVRNAGSTNSFDAWAGSDQFTITSPTATVTSFTANQNFPITSGVPVTFTASAAASSGSVEYEFWEFTSGTGWQIGQAYGSSGVFTWSPAAGTHAVQVWVRRVGSTASWEDWRGLNFTVNPAQPAKVTSLTSTPVAGPWTPITWTATATGGSGTLQYKFWLFRSSTNSWMVLQDWSTSNTTSAWTPGIFNTGQNAVQVWVRSSGSSADMEDWMGTGYFLVTDSTGLAFSSSTGLTGLHSGASVTFTASVSGPGGPYEFEFWTYNGTAWTLAQGYSSNSAFTWVVPAGTFEVQVWARASGSFAPWERWAASSLFVVNP
jgi:hypothetical protein